MEHQGIKELLAAYRKGEGLESDPRIRAALDATLADPELARFHAENEAFDHAFAKAVKSIAPPADLQSRILKAASELPPVSNRGNSTIAFPKQPQSAWQWLHLSAFGVAAAVILFLALSFTFWNRPAQHPLSQQDLAISLAGNSVFALASQVINSHAPGFRASGAEPILAHLREQNGLIPTQLPGKVCWTKSVACDVLKVSGTTVSVVCFRDQDDSMLHLFTFDRSQVDWADDLPAPVMQRVGNRPFAAWSDGQRVHVLYSTQGEENLRAALDI